MEKNRKLSTSLTDNRFGTWGWSMIMFIPYKKPKAADAVQ